MQTTIVRSMKVPKFDALKSLQALLWPGGDENAEWTSDTIEAVAEIVKGAGFGPHDKPRKGKKKKST